MMTLMFLRERIDALDGQLLVLLSSAPNVRWKWAD